MLGNCLTQDKGFSHVLVLLTVAVLVALGIGAGISTTEKQKSSALAPQNVLGENQGTKVLSACSSGNLTTSTNKNFQMMYPSETFMQLANIDLLKDVSQLKDLTCLQYLDATDRTVKGDIANLKNLTNLEVFSLYSNPDVSGDICSLSGATKLRSLKFAFDPKITGDISCLKNLTKLETFAMTHTQISGDISIFANMPNLKAIYLSGTNVKGDICSLKSLTNLEELGIADEYPGNPNITGDLGCLDNLKKLKRVSIYNTGTTNCEQFTKSHPSLASSKTESGKQGGGGCSRESLNTLVDYAQKYEKKIGKDVQTEVRGKPNYNQGPSGGERPGPVGEPNIFQRLLIWVFGLFGKTPPGAPGPDFQNGPEDPNMIRSQAGPGGCRSQAECDVYCDKPEHSEECSKFTPPGGQGGQSEVRPDLEKGGPGGCKSQQECQAYCSKPENSKECSKFAPPGR